MEDVIAAAETIEAEFAGRDPDERSGSIAPSLRQPPEDEVERRSHSHLHILRVEILVPHIDLPLLPRKSLAISKPNASLPS